MKTRILFDATSLHWFNIKEGRGTELWLRQVAYGLADVGYDVHIIAPDAEVGFDGKVNYWDTNNHPMKGDLTVHMNGWSHFSAWKTPRHITMMTGIDPNWATMTDWAKVDVVVALNDFHKDQLVQKCGVPEERVRLLSLMVDKGEYDPEVLWAGTHAPVKIPERFLWCSSPDRGLHHLADIWPLIKKEMPDAELHITYGIDKFFEAVKWQHNTIGQWMWEIKEWLTTAEDVTVLPDLSRQDTIKEQVAATYLLFPCDPIDQYTQFHSLAILECMASGTIPIATNVAGLDQIFDKGVVSIPLPVDPGTWALTIANLDSKPEARDKILEGGKEVVARYTTEKLLPEWEKLVEEVLAA